MGKRGRVVSLVAAGVVLVAVLGTVLFGGPGEKIASKVGIEPLLRGDETGLRAALDVVPNDTKRLSFTDWQAVRKALGAKFGDDPERADIEAMTSKAYDTDFSAVSSIDEAAAALQENFGFSPATMSWEAFAQSDDGATMVVRMPDDFDLGKVKGRLADLGFKKPKDDDGVWDGGVDLTAAIDPTITPELQYVAVLEDEHLIVTSDGLEYAKKVVQVALGNKDSLGDLESARDVVEPLDEPAAAMLWSRDFACADLSMGTADAERQEEGDALVARAGKISPLSGLVMAMAPDRTLTVAQQFEDDDQARSNLRPRAKLAVGEAVGRGGSFNDDFRLTSSRTEGATVLLTLEPRTDPGYVLSALDSGPVLFATC
ncbi:hypothetical protein ABIE44_002272 [Marmoricola sp. OAE513]|uniref:hypothetical protein n=1 Tax=Marmoricola sp. OAE513 TaxID=2817894 RepID=UPI001AEAA3C8